MFTLFQFDIRSLGACTFSEGEATAARILTLVCKTLLTVWLGVARDVYSPVWGFIDSHRGSNYRLPTQQAVWGVAQYDAEEWLARRRANQVHKTENQRAYRAARTSEEREHDLAEQCRCRSMQTPAQRQQRRDRENNNYADNKPAR